MRQSYTLERRGEEEKVSVNREWDSALVTQPGFENSGPRSPVYQPAKAGIPNIAIDAPASFRTRFGIKITKTGIDASSSEFKTSTVPMTKSNSPSSRNLNKQTGFN
jgi:hypothetical protein